MKRGVIFYIGTTRGEYPYDFQVNEYLKINIKLYNQIGYVYVNDIFSQ